MSALEAIKARAADCATYNFGMRNADKLAHEDVPRLVAALEAALSLVDHFNAVTVRHQAGVTEKLGDTLRATINAALEETR